jgi:uncharacterized protein with ParB-like and HNH nuclease domain
MGKFKDESIKKVIDELNQSYFLPDIQREYVWLRKANEKKIEQLFDSILRGYPIGSFLFWKLKKNDIETNKDARDDSDKLNFQLYKFIENYDERKTHNEKVNIEQINADDLSIVLDGQQRLTSLYIGLKGTRTLKKPKAWWDNPNSFEEKQLYINLLYLPKEESPDDGYEFEFHKREQTPQNDDNHYWFKVGNILSLESITKYARENNLSDNGAEILEKLKNAFCSQNLISYFEETEKNLDKVLKIFIRVNSGGTQLSYSDLLMSILTANFSTDIRKQMEEFVDSIQDKGFNIMGRDQVLKTCLLLTDSNHIFQLKNFSKSNIKKIEQNWDRITEATYKAIDFLQEVGYSNRLSSAYILSVIAHFFFKQTSITPIDKVEMLKFVRNAQITSFFTTSLDGKLSIVAPIIRESNNFKEVNDKLEENKQQPLKITKDAVKGMLDFQYGNPAILPILQLLYPNLDYKNSTFHIDHIYPKSKFNNKNSMLPVAYQNKANFLYNLQLLQGDENVSKKAKDPEIWLEEYYHSNKDDISDYKKRNYIDENCKLNWDNIADFENARNQKIREKLEQIFG